jgi:hypothetical protein
VSDLEEVAERLFWWQNAAEALASPGRLLAQGMVYGTAEDLTVLLRHFSADDFRSVLADPPPGLFDPRSWAYWHLVFGTWPAPELPRRRL